VIAIQEYIEPQVLKIPNDEDTVTLTFDGEKCDYTIGAIKEIYEEYYPVVDFCAAMDCGIFTVGLDDYKNLPDLLVQTLMLYKSEKRKMQKGN
jgi:hypothetical protein